MSNHRKRGRRRVLSHLILSLLMMHGSYAFKSLLHPPERVDVYYKLFEVVRSLTTFPFTMIPGLGGADKTKFIPDDLINRDELVHTTTYLKAQLIIASSFAPDRIAELQATINACEFLLRHFNRIASQRDSQNNLAIGEGVIDSLFAAPSTDRSRV